MCVVTAAAAGVLIAQPRAQQQPVFRAGTDLVRVDVVVTDSDDRPITDLTIDDFEIVQGGRPQVISEFDFISIPNANRALDVEGVVPPPPDVASNERPPDSSRAFVMVVDDRHLLSHDIVPTKQVMTDFLQALRPGDEVALVFVGRSDLSTGFTTDVGRLLESVEAVREVFGFGLGAWQPPNMELLRQGVRAGIGGLHPNQLHYMQQTMEVLNNIVRSLASAAHTRRALVFVSAGFNFDIDPSDRTEQQQSAVMMGELLALYERAARANVPIYTLDPRGLVSPYMAVGDPQALSDPGGGMEPAEKVKEVDRRIRLQNDRMAEIALNTGGRAFIKQSNLTAAVDQIVADNGSFYLLGYYPNPYEADGEYHAIDVRVRRPGVRVRARKGYVAPTPAGGIVDPDVSFAETLGEGLPASGLQLRALATALGPAEDGRVATGITVQVTYMPQDSASGVDDEQLRLGVLALDPDARVRMSSDSTFSFSLPPGASGSATMEINHVVDLPRGPSALRLGVASRATGRVGTVHLPIDLPELADDELAVGGIVVGHAGVMSQPRATSPAFRELLPFPPAISRTFDAGSSIEIFVRVFPPPANAAAIQTVLTLSRAGTVATTGAVDCQPSSAAAGALDCRSTLALDDLAPGDYALAFAARAGDDEPVTRAIPISVR